MSTAYIVLLILLIVYIPIWLWVWRCPERAERWHLVKYGPCIMIKTQLGMRTMDRLASHPRFWRAFGLFSKMVSAVLFFLMMYMLVVAVIALPSTLSSGSSVGIEYALAIPGFNPILPLSYGVVALVIAMVVHELAHGIQARANGIRVKSSGLLYGVVPLGAFVEPDEEDLASKPRRAQVDVYAAGITVNTIVAVLSIAILILSCGAVSSDHGDTPGVYYIDADSPAYEAGIPTSALIVGIEEVDGDATYTEDEISSSVIMSGISASIGLDGIDPTKQYRLTYLYHDETYTTGPMQLGMFIKAITSGSPADEAGLEVGDFIYSVEIDGEVTYIGSPAHFTELMSGTSPGDTVTITTVDPIGDDGTVTTTTYEDIVLASSGSIGFLGVSSTTSGMTFVTPDAMMDRATDPFYGADTPFSYVSSLFSYLSGPFNGMDPVSDDVRWWYDVPAGDLFWMAVTLLYWIFWLDILLAISNALPTYVLDGGFIFAGGVSWLLEKIGVRDETRNARLTDSIAGSMSTLTLFLFLMVILAMLI